MNTSLKTFLAELYEIDPGLRAHEAEIVPLIDKLLKNDPATSPDPAFVAQLRTQLKERAYSMQESPASGFQWSNIFYAFGGALTIMIVLPVAYLAWNQTETSVKTGTPLFGYKVEEADGDNAFGPLSGLGIEMASGGMGGTRNQSGGGGPVGGNAPVPASTSLAAPEAVMDYGMTDSKMIAPGIMYQFDYVYDGELKDLTDSVTVFKRDPSGAMIPMSALAGRLNLGTIDLDSFRNMNVESVSFSQNAPYGYQMYVNLRDASLSINAQWDQWPQSKCQTEACYQSQRVKLGDIPADDNLIAIAKSFAEEHGITLADYGAPEVDNNWKREYERATDKANAYIPETMRVVFPLLADGKPVYDQGGAKTGISMGIHVKEKRVMDVWGIADRTYLKSDYAGVTDAAAIKDFISKTDNWSTDTMPRGTDVKKAKVILGEPTLAYATFFSFRNNMSEELLIPSLVFPVKSVEGADEGYYRPTVVVPLAKEMLDEQMNQPQVMPLEGGPAVDPAPRG